MSSPIPDAGRPVLIVGAGIVGLAVAYQLVRANINVAVVDSDPEGDKASLGNAGCIAVTEVIPASVPGLLWRVPGMLLDPLGPLSVRPSHAARLVPWLWRFAKAGSPRELSRICAALAALNARVYEDLVPLLTDIGLPGDLYRNGALTVYESESGFHSDAPGWALKRSHGIESVVLSGTEARQLEPDLGPVIRHAVMTPQWSHVSDPRLVLDTLRRWLQSRGARIIPGRVAGFHRLDHGGLSVRLDGGGALDCGRLIIAAGAWSARLAAQIGDRARLESERGYNTTLPGSGTSLQRTIIFAERKFVASPLRVGLRIGGAAEFGGLCATPDFKRSRALLELASKYLPGLQTVGAVDWAGHRPATPDSLPVISRSTSNPHVFYAFGHGHLGLTQAATTGRLIADMLLDRRPAVDVSPYSIDRFAAGVSRMLQKPLMLGKTDVR